MGDDALTARARALTPAEAAWIAAPSCAVAIVAAMAVLGPPLGHAFLAPGSDRFWPTVVVHREPVEHARYLIALLAPPLLAAVALAIPRRPVRLRPATTHLLTLASQALAVALLAVALLAQHNIVLRSYIPPVFPDVLFTWPTIAVAAALPPLLLVAGRWSEASGRLARLTRETRTRRLACIALAAALTAAWLLTAVNTDATAGNAQASNLIPWDAAETYAVLDGRTPLVDFHSQYAQLWPLLAAALMALVGSSLGVWTVIMATLSGLAMVAIYSVFRRTVHSSLLALALYVPFLAISFFVIGRGLQNRFSPTVLYSLWPLRFAGPYLLAWLTARHLDGAAPRRVWALFLLAGLVALNNVEFGAGAFAASLVALALTRASWSRRGAARLLGSAAAGLLAATVLVALLTLARAGALPRFGLLFEFSRLYGIGGWVLEPMPLMGFHVAMYLTFVAAIAVATLRAASARYEQPVLTGMLAWSGVFGLVAGGYYAGRSDPLNLIALFSPWFLALALLVVVVVRGLARRGWRHAAPAELALLFGFGLALACLPQVPAPWSQLSRLRHHIARPVFEQLDAARFIASRTQHDAQVTILAPLGHRIAYDRGLTNIAPYSGIEAMPTEQQLQTAVDVTRRAHVRAIFVSLESTGAEAIATLERDGFTRTAQRGDILELTDSRPARSTAPGP